MPNLNYPIEVKKNMEVAAISLIKVRLILMPIPMQENSLKCQITPTQPLERPRKDLVHSFLISQKMTRISMLSLEDHMNSTMEPSITANGQSRDFVKEKAFSSGRTVVNTKATGKETKLMATED